jgi:hypothetical protein
LLLDPHKPLLEGLSSGIFPRTLNEGKLLYLVLTVHFDFVDDVGSREELLAAVCSLDCPVDNLHN